MIRGKPLRIGIVRRGKRMRLFVRLLSTALGLAVLPAHAATPAEPYVFSPGIWWIGSTMNRSGSDVQILAMYS